MSLIKPGATWFGSGAGADGAGAGWRRAGELAFVAVAYYGAARLGLLLQLPGTNASPVWPPSGIGLAAMLLLGLRAWPAIMLAAFLANLLTLPSTPAGLLASGAISVGNTLEHVVALLMLRRLVPSPTPFERSRHVFWFVLVACVACAVASTNGAAILSLSGIVSLQLAGQVWFTWWLGDTAGMLVLTPALYCWCRAPRLGLPVAKLLELAALVIVSVAAAELLFGGWVESKVIGPLPYLLLPCLLWAAFRFGPRETASLSVLLSGIAIARIWWWSRLAGPGSAVRAPVVPFLSPDVTANESLLMLQIFICAIAVTAIALSAAVAERARVERERRESDERLRLFIAQAPVAIAMFDRGMRYIAASRRWLSDYGLGNRDLRGLSHYEVFPNLPDRWRDAHRRGLGGEVVTATEDRFVRDDGTVQWLHWEIHPWYDTSGQGGIIIFAEEISEQKRLEARFRATVESAPMGMVMIDDSGTMVLVNAEMERLFGYGREELLGRKIEGLIPGHFRSAHPSRRDRYFAAPRSRRMGEGRDLFGLRKDGSEFPVEIGLSPVTTDEGSFVLAAIVDISERLRQASALRHSHEALERSNIELQRFAYVASHDLQTPMRGIASFAELLQTTYADKLDAQAKDWIRRVVQSTRQMQTLVRDLLEYSRVDSQPHPFQPVPFREVFDHAVSLLDASVREANAEVSCGELPVVTGDRSQLVQLMLNLIGNALKYRGADPPRVHVSAERSAGEDTWTFAVRDNGIGIDRRHQEQIFEIFRRLHDQKEIPGTGIGLAVCRRVVQRHGGRIWVESEPGRGSTFFFTIAAAAGGDP